METQVVNQPMFYLALSERELQAALDDATAVQAALRRQWLDAKGVAPLALPSPVAPTTRKMGGAKPEKPVATAREGGTKKGGRASKVFKCDQCDAERKTQGHLNRHKMLAHGSINVLEE